MKYNRYPLPVEYAPIRYCEHSGKPIYDKRTAVTAMNRRFREAHVKLRTYPCPSCKGWHLTSKLKH